MKKLLAYLVLNLLMINHANSAVWVKLHEDNTSKLMLDKQSLLQKEQLKRAWVKIEYKSIQHNTESPEKEYNMSKLLWFFDCGAQKTATTQLFQYLNNELIYSAGIDSKSAEYVEPAPETEVDIAMRYVCLTDKTVMPAAEATVLETKPKAPVVKTSEPAKTSEEKSEPVIEAVEPPAAKVQPKPELVKIKTNPSVQQSGTANWAYEGQGGPEHWGKINPDFISCESGRNQSPINIEGFIHAYLKPIRSIQKFSAKEIVNNGHVLQVSFNAGNMLVLDSNAYQLKTLQFHAPSENTINGKSYPLEAQFIHTDAKGNITILAVMFIEGKSNTGLEKLWLQIPEKANIPTILKTRVIPSDLIPENKTYFRFTGSLTNPPCSEGIRWIVMKTPMTVSKSQIDRLFHVFKHNNRPVQALNGRTIID